MEALGDLYRRAILEDDDGARRQLLKVLFSAAKRYLGNDSEVDDVVQESLLRIDNALETGNYVERGNWKSWVFVVVRNAAIQLLRAKSKRPALSLPDEPESATESPEDPVELAERRDVVHGKIMELTDERQRKVLLCRLDGLNQIQTADALDLSRRQVQTAERNALLTLRRTLKDPGAFI